MNRTNVERAIDNFYKARLSNQTSQCLACFTDDATLELSGSNDASAIAGQVTGRSQLEAMIDTLIGAWDWHEIENVHSIIDGGSVAVRYKLIATFTPTKETIETQVMDNIEFDEDMKVKTMTQFVDTAMVQKLINNAQTM